jgi:hypothetical protein
VTAHSSISPLQTIQTYLASHPSVVDPVDVLVDIFHKEMYGDRPRREKMNFSLQMQKIRSDWQANRSFLKKFRVSQLPAERSVSNCPAAEYTASLLYENFHLSAPVKLRVRSIAIMHHDYTFLLRLTDTEAQPVNFDPFIGSIKLI